MSAPAPEDFRVGHPTEVLALLHQLGDGRALLHLCAANGAAYSTTLCGLDERQHHLSLAADAQQPAVHALVEAGEATAVAYLDSIKLQFDLRNLVLVHGSQASALQAAWPEALYRFQRRESFRVRTPASAAPTAHLRHPALPEMRLALRLLDIGAGGCALALPADVPPLHAGVELDGVRIDLDADTHFETTLSLQHVSLGMAFSDAVLRLGCAFGPLDGAAQRTLQRYIDRTQKRQRLFSQ
jgi:flagellar brake protein